MIKLYYICSLKSSIFLNFFKLDNQFFCRALKYIILRRKKLDKIILYKFYLILINLIYLLLITAKMDSVYKVGETCNFTYSRKLLYKKSG